MILKMSLKWAGIKLSFFAFKYLGNKELFRVIFSIDSYNMDDCDRHQSYVKT